ncbi:MAG: aminopeptidase P N-terminal domain-containing protein, partial [Bacteroidales bacterium]|nr:aminopeptidase P N-terminal domain-containing protein [Bacteroidales bacterium]
MFEAEIYIERRKKLREKLSSGILLFPANSESSMNYPGNCFHFRQDSSFLYYFGLDTPDMFGYMDVESGEEILFADELTIEDIVWMGYQPTFADQAKEVGIRKVLPVGKLQDYLFKAASQSRKVHYLPPYQGKIILLLSQLLNIAPAMVGNSYSIELVKAVIAMRTIKEDREIEEIEKACQVGYEMHISAFRNCRPGKSEQELYGIMEGIAYQLGTGTSFPTILSQNGETLHNYNHYQILTEGRLLLVDAGAEALSHYCSDHTRTIPVSGKFTPFQAEIYNLVVAAQAKGIELSAPEVTNQSIHLAVCKVLAEGLKEAGIMKGNVDDAVAAGA